MAFGNKINKILDEKSTTTITENELNKNKNVVSTTTTTKKSFLSKDITNEEEEDDCGTCELLGVNEKKNQMFQMISNVNNNSNNNNNSSEEDSKYWEPIPTPPTSIELGNSGWTLLHTIAAYYPEKPSEKKKQEVKEFLQSFSKVYPCNVCAKDFREIMKETPPKLDTQYDFALWLCNAHNNVNLQLGKPTFDYVEEEEEEGKLGNKFLEDRQRFKVKVEIPMITLDSQYKKYAQMVKGGVDLEIIKKEAIKDSVELSTQFYNTIIYIYILKLDSLRNVESILKTESIIESIFRDIYRPNKVTLLLNALSISKQHSSNKDQDILIESINGLLSNPNSYLFCENAFQILLQTLYNLENYKMVILIYKELVHLQNSIIGDSGEQYTEDSIIWNSGIIIHSMAMINEISSTDMKSVFNKSNLPLNKNTQFHYNCLANKYLCEGLIVEAWSILKELYLRDLGFDNSIPSTIIQLLKSSEDYELAVQMSPLLLSILIKDVESTSSLWSLSLLNEFKQLLLDSGDIAKHLMPLESNLLFNPFSSQYILSKKSIETIKIEPTPSILGIKLPILPKHKRVTLFDRINKLNENENENENEDENENENEDENEKENEK
ncbi:hypothetical protein RB653_010271 [Dictyostelium firmibasis]|uniref:Sulfhydryl oxidase n=1 Tax=Dictyostelium firmibasis TaxID=79012 RepID=A0AAN7YPM6_9MYCE